MLLLLLFKSLFICTMFPDLNLPAFNARVTRVKNEFRIFDGIRKKFVLLTPEEWVRQHFINFLITENKYPASLIVIERGHRLNTLRNRTDIVVHNQEGKPWLLVECKAPEIDLTEAVFYQALRYHLKLNVDYIVITNGFKHFYCKRNASDFVFIPELPLWDL